MPRSQRSAWGLPIAGCCAVGFETSLVLPHARQCRCTAEPMTKFFIIISICIGVGLIGGCTTSIRAPKAFFNKVEAASREHEEVVAGFNSTVVHAAGLSMSISGSYSLPMVAPGAAAPAKIVDYTFTYSGKPDFSLHVRGPGSCFPASAAEDQLGNTLQRTLDSVGGFPAAGSVAVDLSLASEVIQRYAFSMRRGRAYSLKYFVACKPGDSGQELLYAAMLALHEATHVSLSLWGLQSRNPETRESVAIGGETCLLMNLMDWESFRQHAHQRLDDRLALAAGGGAPMSRQKRCELWRDTLRQSHAH